MTGQMGVLNTRFSSGALTRRIIMQTRTATKAAKVPALARAAISPSGRMPASRAARTPVIRVTKLGAPRLETFARPTGSRPSLAMTKKMRLWPYMKAMITVGRAMTAAAATSLAAPPWPSCSMTKTSGASAFEKTPGSTAPIAAAATTM